MGEVFVSISRTPTLSSFCVRGVRRSYLSSETKRERALPVHALAVPLSAGRRQRRVRAMAAAGWKSTLPALSAQVGEADEEGAAVDLEELARDQIARLIIQRFKGHGLARLVEAVLKAQDDTTYRSPEGPDKGVDILAAPGPLGFGRPRLCVQVKSADSPLFACRPA